MSHSDMALPEHLINVPPEEWGRTIVAAIRDLYLTVFPNRIKAIYLLGSGPVKQLPTAGAAAA